MGIVDERRALEGIVTAYRKLITGAKPPPASPSSPTTPAPAEIPPQSPPAPQKPA